MPTFAEGDADPRPWPRRKPTIHVDMLCSPRALPRTVRVIGIVL